MKSESKLTKVSLMFHHPGLLQFVKFTGSKEKSRFQNQTVQTPKILTESTKEEIFKFVPMTSAQVEPLKGPRTCVKFCLKS